MTSRKRTRRRTLWWRLSWSIVVLEPSFQLFATKGPWHTFGLMMGIIAVGLATSSLIQIVRLGVADES